MTLPVDTVKVKLPLPKDANARTTIRIWTSQSTLIQKCSAYPTAPNVQTVVKELDGAVSVLADMVAEIDQLRARLSALEVARNTQVELVRVKHDAVRTQLTSASNNDPEAAAAWVGETEERAKPENVPPSTDPPVSPGLSLVKKHRGTVKARCEEEAGAVGYLFQTGGDPKDPDAWPLPIYSHGFTHTFRGLPLGQLFYARIAVVRRGSVQGAWSHVLSIVVG